MRNTLKYIAVTLLLAAVHISLYALPNPYRAVDSWAQLPDGRTMGAVGDLTMDPDGLHLWVIIRCDASAPDRFGNECLDSDLDPVLKFDLDGNVVESFGSGLFVWPHGLDVDQEGNVWVTDAVADTRMPKGTLGHQVIKFSPEGEVLMVLGTPGESGGGRDHFDRPSDVVIAGNGDIFVTDGHSRNGNNRVVKFSSDGTYLKNGARPDMHPASSGNHTPLPSTNGVGFSWLIASTTGFRFSIRKVLSSPSGPSLDDPAAYTSMNMTAYMSPIPNPTTYKIPVGRWA
jgi:hypothetical protein